MQPIDEYFELYPEPIGSCLRSLRSLILRFDKHITEVWQYGMPFFRYRGRRFAYLWVHKKHKQPYIGFVDGKLLDDPELLSESRSRMKILLVDPANDLPLDKISGLLGAALALCE